MISLLHRLLYYLKHCLNKILIVMSEQKKWHLGTNLSIQPRVIIDVSRIWHISTGDDMTIAPHVHILPHDAGTKRTLNFAYW